MKERARRTYEQELALFNQRQCLLSKPGSPPDIPAILQPRRT